MAQSSFPAKDFDPREALLSAIEACAQEHGALLPEGTLADTPRKEALLLAVAAQSADIERRYLRVAPAGAIGFIQALSETARFLSTIDEAYGFEHLDARANRVLERAQGIATGPGLTLFGFLITSETQKFKDSGSRQVSVFCAAKTEDFEGWLARQTWPDFMRPKNPSEAREFFAQALSTGFSKHLKTIAGREWDGIEACLFEACSIGKSKSQDVTEAWFSDIRIDEASPQARDMALPFAQWAQEALKKALADCSFPGIVALPEACAPFSSINPTASSAWKKERLGLKIQALIEEQTLNVAIAGAKGAKNPRARL